MSEPEDEVVANKETLDANADFPAPSFNPSDDEEDDENGLDPIRGDAIGDTLYTKRFVLATLIKLNKSDEELSQDTDLENDLCALWDMTVEKDVIYFLLEQNVIEIFVQFIEKTENKRLVEIVLGIMGNMATLPETCNEIIANEYTFNILLEMANCTDSLSLIQLMRLLKTVISSRPDTYLEKWLDHICKTPEFLISLTDILSNSLNETLITLTIDTVDTLIYQMGQIREGTTILVSLSSEVKEKIITSSFEAFDLFISINYDKVETILPNPKKVLSKFLNIHTQLTEKDSNTDYYTRHMEELINRLRIILKIFCVPRHLFPIEDFQDNVLEGLFEIFRSFQYPFDEICLKHMITIWKLIQNCSTNCEPNSKEPFWSLDVIHLLIRHVVEHADIEELKKSFCAHKQHVISELVKSICDKSDITQNTIDKLKSAENAMKV